MRNFSRVFVSVSVLLSASLAFGQRGIGAGSFILDDGHSHTITLLAPSGLDGNYIYTLPQSPGGNIMSGYVGTGSAFGQVLYWNGSYWQPSGTGASGQVLTLNGAGVPTWITGGGGGIAGSGTAGMIPIWTGDTTQGNSLLSDDGTTLSYSGQNVNTQRLYEIGGSPVLWNPGTNNIFLGEASALSATYGHDNTYLGTLSGQFSGGVYNTFTGASSGSFQDEFGNGYGNTFTGYAAGYHPGNGKLNTGLGYQSQVFADSNATAIGANAQVTASNSVQLGDANVTLINAHGSFNTTGGGFQTNGTTVIDNGRNATLASVNASGTVTLTGLASGTPTNFLALDASNNVVLASGGSGISGISGSGIAGTIPLWTGDTTQGNSAITDDGSTVSVTNGDALLFSGTTGTTPASGAGTRMEWIPAKAAFRAGFVGGTDWDDSIIGYGSTAMGVATTASGAYSIAMGQITTASEQASIALGSGTIASGIVSTAMGTYTTASGDYSTAMGYNASTNGMAGTFVYGDNSTFTVMNAAHPNEFDVRAAGGVNFYTTSDLSTFVSFPANGGITVTGGNVTLTSLASGTPVNYLALDASNNVVLSSGSGGGVSGTGTTGTIAIWTSSTTISNSLLTDDGSTLSYASARINTDSEYAISGNRVFTTVGGIDDVFAGYRAGLNISGGYADAFFGFDAGRDNSSGNYNTFVGSSAGQDNNSGHDNTYTGSAAGQNNTTGYENTFVGRAGGNINSAGSFNTFIGGESGTNNTTGSNNTVLGQSANVASGTLTDATAIGANAIVTASNTVQLGDSNVTAVNAAGSYNSTNGGFETNGTTVIDNNTNGTFTSVNTDNIYPHQAGDDIIINSGGTWDSSIAGPHVKILNAGLAVKDGDFGVGKGLLSVGGGDFQVQHDGTTTINEQSSNDALTINGSHGGNDITGTSRSWYVDGSGFLLAGNGIESDNGIDVYGTGARYGRGIFVQNGGIEINNDMLRVDGDGADIGGPTRLENDYSDVLTIVGSGSHNDITGTSDNWQVDGSGNGTFNTLGASSTINSNGGSLQTNSTTRIDNGGTFTVGGNLIASTESDAESGDQVTVSGTTLFAEVTGSGSGNLAVNVTHASSGQMLYLFNNTTGSQTLMLNGSTVAQGKMGVFVYYGGNWRGTN